MAVNTAFKYTDFVFPWFNQLINIVDKPFLTAII